jgi:diguanylate cyclase (GGDEF)-like protein
MYFIDYLLIPVILAAFLYGFKVAYPISILASIVAVIIFKFDPFSSLIYVSIFNLTPLIIQKFNLNFKRYRESVSSELEKMERSHQNLVEEDRRVYSLNRELEEKVSQTASLYEITREMSKSLELEQIFSIFKDNLTRHIKYQDCLFALPNEEIFEFKKKGYQLFPLQQEKENLGYLAISGINRDEYSRYSILTNLLALDIRRANLYQRVQELAITDGLTGVYVRRHVLERFSEEWQRSMRRGLKLSFLMADIDHFKSYNDRYGHLVGDVVLREIARIIKSNTREIDLIGRYGGEEFSIVLPDTDKTGAFQVAERIRSSIEGSKIKAYDEMLNVTISLGIAVFPEDGGDTQELIEKADKALYEAKQKGRNRVSNAI